jgi:hypothetical protein
MLAKGENFGTAEGFNDDGLHGRNYNRGTVSCALTRTS